MSTNVKKIFFLLPLLILFTATFFSPQIRLAYATETPYVPLAPLTTAQDQPVNSSTYIPTLFRLGIGIAAGLAVLAIAYGGIKYMLSDVVTNKSDAIKGIKNALLGLLLALAAFLILRTINPALVNTSF